MGSKRKKKRRIQQKIKLRIRKLLIILPIVIAVVLLLIFGFRIKSVTLSSDLGQYKDTEVLEYLNYKGIDNSLFLWIRSVIGKEPQLDLFEKYSVTLESPSKVKITSYEKKLKGYIEKDKVYTYIDENATVLKITSDKIKGVPKVTGLDCKKTTKYNVIELENKGQLEILKKIISCIESYNYEIKRYHVNKEAEATVYIKDIQVEFGKASQLEKRVKAFNDLYDQVIKDKGVLNMKRLDERGYYTLKDTTKSKKKK